MELGILRNRKIHKKKCGQHITLMIIPDPTKKATVIKIPKWLRFPILVSSIAIVLGSFYLVDYMARLEYQLVEDRHTKQVNQYVIEDKETIISGLEITNEAHYDQLLELEELQIQLEAQLADIQKYKDELNQFVNSTDKTTTEQPSELLEIQEADPIVDLDEIDEFIEETNLYNHTVSKELPVYQSSISYELEDFELIASSMKSDYLKALEAIDEETDEYEVLDQELEVMAEFWDAYPSGMPVEGGYVISDFGYRIHPVYRAYKFHYGVDIKAYYTSIYATGAGTVIKAAYQSGYGYTIEIDHGYGYITKYAHMSKFSVSVGDQVVRGDKIGVSGNSGVSSGAHLHYEVIQDGKKIDPEPFLQ